MVICLIAMGANLGDRIASLENATTQLDETPGIRVVARSRWFHTRPIGGPDGQDQFVNAALRLETELAPMELLQAMRRVEAGLGREQRTRWAARTVDLDLLLYGQEVIVSAELRVPHPRMPFRRFVLEPAADVDPDLVHPEIGWTVRRLLQHLNETPNVIAITGPPRVGKTQLAQHVARAAGIHLIEDAPIPATDGDDGLTVDQELGLFRQRAERVEQYRSDRNLLPAISDFWIGQSLVYALADSFRQSGKLSNPGGDLASSVPTGERDQAIHRIRNVWESKCLESLAPKLLVWLRAGGGGEPILDAAFRTAIGELYEGPILELDANQSDWAVVELQAAIESMQ